ncbi:MAG: sigma-70 family RNA polymerase sigma factor [Verrucomicrobia subdivision 3 bacterium]|nr:sigma-70 family RNA polymerase sigma factor [Limisphaerales bacterium]
MAKPKKKRSRRADRVSTPVALLERLRDSEDFEGWREFMELYQEVVWRFCLKAGLEEEDAADVTQETFVQVARAIHRFQYDPDRASFKTWLLLLARSRIIDHFRRDSRQPTRQRAGAGETDAIEQLPDPESIDPLRDWEAAQLDLLDVAQKRVQRTAAPKQFQMFDLYVNRDWPVEKVAAKLGVSKMQVYLARTRVAKLIRAEVAKVIEEEKS